MLTSKRILLVDDETDITANIAPVLERSGFVVATAVDGIDALRQIDSFVPDLVVSDVLMPNMDGRSLLRHLRHNNNWLPVILLTQVGGSLERAMALEEGADDYLNKPFDPFELIARIRAVLRRAEPGKRPLAVSRKLRCGQLILDRTAKQASFDGQALSLTPKAISLLEYFMTHPDELMLRDRLLDAVWGWDYPAGTRTVDTRIAELRRALQDNPSEPQFIETVPGEGYRFVGSVERVA
ncbi:MAG: response regulator transcription factor [Chloroflexota bacterium]